MASVKWHCGRPESPYDAGTTSRLRIIYAAADSALISVAVVCSGQLPALLSNATHEYRVRRFALSPTDLLRDPIYRRLWTSILISSFGGQVTLLALPLTAAVLLRASAAQMGILTAMELVPFVLFSLPVGVWLDRWRKLRVYVFGEFSLACTVASVPLAWWSGWLSISWLYVAAFVIGTVNTTAGSAAQIVLTQIVPRERLVEAHAKNALASSTAEVAGPRGGGCVDQAHRRAARAAGDRGTAADLGVQPARRGGEGTAGGYCAPRSGRRCAKACGSCAASGCCWCWPAP